MVAHAAEKGGGGGGGEGGGGGGKGGGGGGWRGYLVQLHEGMLLPAILQDDNPSRVRSDDDVVLGSSCESKGRERPDDSEHIAGQNGLDFAVVIWSQQLQVAAPRHNNLLGLGCREIAVDGTLQACIGHCQGAYSLRLNFWARL